MRLHGAQPLPDSSPVHGTWPDDGFSADVACSNGRAVVTVRGEIDMATADALSAAVERASALSRQLTIDLTATAFMDSSGLAVLARTHRRLEEDPDALVVRVSPTSPVRRVMAVSGLDRLVTVHIGPVLSL